MKLIASECEYRLAGGGGGEKKGVEGQMMERRSEGEREVAGGGEGGSVGCRWRLQLSGDVDMQSTN